jgi:hypothetical protein
MTMLNAARKIKFNTTNVADAIETAKSKFEALRDEYQKELQAGIGQLEEIIGTLDCVSGLPERIGQIPINVVIPARASSKWVSKYIRCHDAQEYVKAVKSAVEKARDEDETPEDSDKRLSYKQWIQDLDDASSSITELEWLV